MNDCSAGLCVVEENEGERLRMEHLAYRGEAMDEFIAKLVERDIDYKLIAFIAQDAFLVFIRDPDRNSIQR